MNLVVLVGWLFLHIDSATATQCLSCAPMRSSVPCYTTTNCSSGQDCYAKYVMKPDGTVMYEFGCHNSQTCPDQMGSHALIGKRATGDKDLCYKCCQRHMCNQDTLCTATTSTTSSSTTTSTATDLNLCSGSPCMHGNCFSASADYFCQCEQGWQGKNCDQRLGPCARGPCVHGNCFESSIDYVCQCQNGWTGKNCDQATTSTTPPSTTISATTDLNLCSGSPCMHGNCFSGSADYFCQCEQGWQGKNCDHHLGPCARGPCVHGYCFESGIDYVCQCQNGWTGKNCDQADGQWGAWTSWSLCTSHCYQARTRACDNPAPLFGGRDCPGLKMQEQSCYTSSCQVKDCSELLSRGGSRGSGVYTITTPLTHTEIQVYCDMVTDGGGWTVFQKRFDGSESFYRNFWDYENGFGSVHAEHWLGLKYIYEITSSGSYQLRVDIKRSNGNHGFDVYENFSLQPRTNYVLNIGSRVRSDGVATAQSFTWPDGHQPAGRAFSTYDHGDSSDCASQWKGGWWYHSCYNFINLNGLYLPGQFDDRAMKYDDAFGVAASTMMFKRL